MADVKVKPHDMKKIVYTDKCRFHKPGSVSSVHVVQAEKMIKSGKAVEYSESSVEQYSGKKAQKEEAVEPKNKSRGRDQKVADDKEFEV